MLVAVMIIGSLSIPSIALAEPAGGGGLTFKPPNAPPVIFTHDDHSKEQGLKCSACHYQLFQMAHGSYKMDMGKITKGEFCGRCHNGQVSFDAEDPQRCARCHR
jgi:c(7)-type cytochrome triheme protein